MNEIGMESGFWGKFTAAPALDKHESVHLICWKVVHGSHGSTLIGITLNTGLLRSSSPIVLVDPAGDVITASGRQYRLYGASGGSPAVARLICKSFPETTDVSQNFAHLAAPTPLPKTRQVLWEQDRADCCIA